MIFFVFTDLLVMNGTVGNLLLALLRLSRPTVKALEKPGLLIPSEYASF